MISPFLFVHRNGGLRYLPLDLVSIKLKTRFQFYRVFANTENAKLLFNDYGFFGHKAGQLGLKAIGYIYPKWQSQRILLLVT